MRPLRIILVTNNYTPYSGGLVSSLNSQLDILQTQGHSVFLITFAFLTHHTDQNFAIIRLPVRYRFRYRENHIVIPLRMQQQLTQLYIQIRPDVVHIHHPFLLAKSAARLAYEQNIPVCFTYHTLYHHYLHYIPLPRYITAPITTWMIKRIFRYVDHVIVPSQSVADHVQIQTTKPISVVPSAVQKDFIHRHFTKQYRAITDPFHILVVSRFVDEKNIPFALDAFSYLYHDNRFYLTLVGFGYLYKKLIYYAHQIKKFGYDRISFINKPTTNIIATAYQKSDVFLFTSYTDTQGLVLAESLMAGTPIITVPGMGQRDTIMHGQNGLYADNPEKMAYYCKYLANNPHYHYRLAKHAFITGQRFLPEQIGIRLESIFQSLVPERIMH